MAQPAFPQPSEVRLGGVLGAVDDAEVLRPPALDPGLGETLPPAVDDVGRLHDHSFTTAARELRTHGIDLDARLVVESYTVLPALIAGTGRVALVQRQLGAAMATTGRVRMVDCPFPTAPSVEAMWWHPGHENDPAHQWLRRCFVDAAIQIQQ